MRARRTTPQDKLVVVIDDDRAILEAMEGLLRAWGYSVVTAVSGADALHRLAELGRRPDLIVCDHRLSQGEFGTQAIERLREVFEIPALLITADRASDVREGRYQMLLKPLNPDLLRDAIDEALKDKPLS